MESLNLPEWANTAAHISAILGAIGLAVGFSKPICRFLVKVYREIVFLFQQRQTYENLSGRVNEILSELRPNSGGSVADSVNRIEKKVDYFGAARRAKMNTEAIPQVETDVSGRVVWGNRAFLQLVGRTASEICGSGWVNVIAPEERAHIENLWNHTVEEGRVFDEEETYVHSSGERFGVHVIANPIKSESGEFYGYLAEIQRTDQ